MSQSSDEGGDLSPRELRKLRRDVTRLGEEVNRTVVQINQGVARYQQEVRRDMEEGRRMATVGALGLQKNLGREIQIYSGEPQQSFEEFCDIFEIVTRASGLTDQRRAELMPAFLRGVALDKYKELNPNLNYTQLKTALRQAFTNPADCKYKLAQLNARRQYADEPILTFAYEIKKLVKDAYPSFRDQDRERLGLQYFLDRMRPEVKDRLLGVDFATFEEALSKAQSLESALGLKEVAYGVAVGAVSHPQNSIDPRAIFALTTREEEKKENALMDKLAALQRDIQMLKTEGERAQKQGMRQLEEQIAALQTKLGSCTTNTGTSVKKP